MSDRTPEIPELPNHWQLLESDQVYRSSTGMLVSFSATQIQLGVLYDVLGKHLKAIHKGIVAPTGSIGLVPSEVPDYNFKSKILGKGGDRRFHAKVKEGVLHFPGKMTTH